jgi:pentatricopeptide repeat protein
MLGLIRIAATTSSVLRSSLLIPKVAIGASCSYSSNTPNSTNNRPAYPKKKKGKPLISREDTDKIDRLLLLVQERKFGDFLKFLKEALSLKQIIFSRVMQSRFGGLSVSREIELKEKIIVLIRERGLKPNSSSITPLITLYGKADDLGKADALLEMMKEEGIKRDANIYNSLMKCHANYKTRVDELHKLMIDEGIKPDIYTYCAMVVAFARSGAVEKVEELFVSMKKDGIAPNIVIYNNIISAYARIGDLDKATGMFASMKKEEFRPDFITYTSMIDAYAKNGEADKAEEMLAEMKEGGKDA